MESYYAFEGRIRYYAPLPKTLEIVQAGGLGTPGDFRGTLGPEMADPSRWKEPPHVVLANLLADKRAVEEFVRKYGPLLGRRTYLMPKDGAPQFYENLAHFNLFQEVVRRAWADEEDAIKNIEGRVGSIGSGRILLSAQNGSLEANVPDLERFICLLVLRDRAEGKIAICENADCPARYFLRQRKGQQFCSHKCAVLINVRRFRRKAAEKQTRRRK